METLAVALAAVALLAAVAVAGWVLYAKSRKKTGEFAERITKLEEERDARAEQDRAFNRARGNDLRDDRDRVPDVP